MKLCLLGTLRLWHDGKTTLFNGQTAVLLGILGWQAASGQPISRSRLVGLLHPDLPENRARRLLTNTLYRLRRNLPELDPHLSVTSDAVGLEGVWIDVAAFLDGLKTADFAQKEAALALYDGDLLAEQDAEWLHAPRAELRNAFLQAVPTIVSHLVAEKQDDAALRLVHRWQQVEPLDEEAARLAMQLHWQAGRATVALQQYQAMRQQLQGELGVAPSAELVALAAEIELKQTAVLQERSEAAVFVGRQSERVQLLRGLGQLEQGKGGVVLLEGEAGLGKTALLAELEKTAVWRELQVAWGEAEEAVINQPFAQLADALRRLLFGQRLAQMAAALPPIFSQILQPLLHSNKVKNEQPSPSAYQIAPSMSLALGRLLQWLTGDKPLVLLLDDVQWAERGFWELLPTVVEQAKRRPILLVLSYRPALRQQATGWQALLAIEQQVTPLRLRLDGLSREETAVFVQASGRSSSTTEIERLHAQSDGNPLILQQLLQQPARAMGTLGQLFSTRLAALEATAKEALQAAAILGRTVSFGAWQQMVSFPLPLAPLMKANVLKEVESGYQFAHDLLRAHLLEEMPKAEKRRWHAQAAAILRGQQAEPATLAWHFEQANDAEQAVHYYLRAAEAALWQNAFGSARDYGGRAARLGEQTTLSEERGLSLRLMQLQLSQIESWSSAQEAEAVAIAQAARALDDVETLHGVTMARLRQLTAAGDVDGMRLLGDEAIEQAWALGKRPLLINTLNEVARLWSVYTLEPDKALPLAEEAVLLARRVGQPAPLATSLITVISICFQTDRVPAGQALLPELDGLMVSDPSLSSLEIFYLNLQARGKLYAGDLEGAYDIQKRRVALCQEGRAREELYNSLFRAALMARKIGQMAEGVLYAEQLLAETEARSDLKDESELHYHRALLADSYLGIGDLKTAEKHLLPVLAWIDKGGKGRAAVYGWIAYSSLCYYLGEFGTAYEAAQNGLTLHQAAGSLTYMPLLAMAEAAHHAGWREKAAQHLSEALAQMTLELPNNSTVYAAYIRALIEADPVQLGLARQQLVLLTYQLKRPLNRRAYWFDYIICQSVAEAWAARTEPKVEVVQVARQDAANGRLLTEADRVTIRWTVDDGLHDRVLAEQGKVHLRRQRLLRLALEASVQGGAATHEDLAMALGVTTRTIERDAVALAEEGFLLHTRRFFLKK